MFPKFINIVVKSSPLRKKIDKPCKPKQPNSTKPILS